MSAITAVMAVFACLLCAPPSPPEPRLATAPNVVLVIADDMGYRDFGFMGHPQIRTPRLDRLARQSLAFRRGYVTSSLCSPSLASILTGRYPHQHKITSNDPPLPPGVAAAAAARHPAFLAARREMIRYFDDLPTLPRAARGTRLPELRGRQMVGRVIRARGLHARDDSRRPGTRRPARRSRACRSAARACSRSSTSSTWPSTRRAPFFLWYARHDAPFAAQSARAHAGQVPRESSHARDRQVLGDVRVVRRDSAASCSTFSSARSSPATHS